MKKGCMMVSGYLLGVPYEDIYRIYSDTARAMGITLAVVNNCQLHMRVTEGKPALTGLPFEPDFILFLDKDILLAKHLEAIGYPVFNSARTIALCDNKADTLQTLYHAGIKLPETVFPPFFTVVLLTLPY